MTMSVADGHEISTLSICLLLEDILLKYNQPAKRQELNFALLKYMDMADKPTYIFIDKYEIRLFAGSTHHPT